MISPSPHELDALAPLVESARQPVPYEAFRVLDPYGEDILVIPLADYEAMRCVAEKQEKLAKAEARSRDLWEKRAKATQTIAAGFGVVLTIIAAAVILRALEGLWR